MRVLAGGVGYTNLRDLSVGPRLVEQLLTEPWPPGVDVLDLGYGAVHVMHDLQERQAAAPYERIVLFGTVTRGRVPGTVTSYRWDHSLPDAETVQAHVADAVTGVISLDCLLIVGQQFGTWPEEVLVVEIEPADESWGPGYSPAVEGALDTMRAAIRQAALATSAASITDHIPA